MSNTQDLVKQDSQPNALQQQSTAALIPPVDITEDDSGITVVADLPGATRDTLSIDVNGDTLTLEATLGLDQPQGLQGVYAEVRAARYRRSFTLSRELDSAHIDATLKDGVLTLRVPKLEQAKPRRIQVRAS
jgi:HSP20 family molecular chaperone IbpA